MGASRLVVEFRLCGRWLDLQWAGMTVYTVDETLYVEKFSASLSRQEKKNVLRKMLYVFF